MANLPIARTFMEYLLVLPHLDKSRPFPCLMPSCNGSVVPCLCSLEKVNFGVLALTSPMLRQSQFYGHAKMPGRPCAAALCDRQKSSQPHPPHQRTVRHALTQAYTRLHERTCTFVKDRD